jgi:hypothetical protein
MKLLKPFALLTAALLLTTAPGCRDSTDSHGHSHGGEAGHSHDQDQPLPHGGTPVLIAEDQFHLELVLDAPAARIQAYVLDGHLEGYVPVTETNFALNARLGDRAGHLAFRRVPGQNPPASSLFEAQADWLKTAREFEATLPSITLAGKTFTNISFSFPKGSKHVH